MIHITDFSQDEIDAVVEHFGLEKYYNSKHFNWQDRDTLRLMDTFAGNSIVLHLRIQKMVHRLVMGIVNGITTVIETGKALMRREV